MNLTKGTSREQIDPADVTALRARGVLINDARRERPRYFDGRFLAARDLIREQQYFLTREADLGRAAGSGVAAGLFVREGAEPQTLEVQAGHGSAPSGELVLLPRHIQVRLADIPIAEQLSARFGLSRQPAPPMRSRTGLFVLALRPVEFTANPIGAYPTSITGQRSVEDGDIIEGTAIVLVPWNDDGATDALQARRGHAARAIFTQGVERGVSANVLPLAMLALQNNTLVWIDEAMVRRELGADRGDMPGLGFAPRALRLAHLMQYQEHLQDVVARSNGRSFFASEYFPALPSAGPLPAGVINAADFTQNFFPAEIDVDFSIVPEDELPALVEEALTLQAIDLSVPVESLDSTTVMILAPVPRHEWRVVVTRLGTATTRLVKPAAPNLLAQRKPFEVLQQLRVPRTVQGALDPSKASDAEWQRLASLPNLWFVRRRHLAYRDDYTGVWQQVTGIDERAAELALRTRVGELGLTGNLDAVLKNATPAAASTITNLLASAKFSESPALTAAAIGSLSSAMSTATDSGAVSGLDQASVLKVASQLSAPGVGDGLQKVELAAGAEKISSANLQAIAASDEWTKVDAVASVASRAEVVEIASNKLNIDAVTSPTTGVLAPTKPVVGASAPTVVASPVTGTAAPIVTKTVAKAPVTTAKTAAKSKASTVKKPK
ncbi:MAG: hypothetical protein IH606_00655 [Burkholderiales bacterium]|nr:hypothetical protein [Burkholderiales bacterium]